MSTNDDRAPQPDRDEDPESVPSEAEPEQNELPEEDPATATLRRDASSGMMT
jgi:hypothetical protein